MQNLNMQQQHSGQPAQVQQVQVVAAPPPSYARKGLLISGLLAIFSIIVVATGSYYRIKAESSEAEARYGPFRFDSTGADCQIEPFSCQVDLDDCLGFGGGGKVDLFDDETVCRLYSAHNGCAFFYVFSAWIVVLLYVFMAIRSRSKWPSWMETAAINMSRFTAIALLGTMLFSVAWAAKGPLDGDDSGTSYNFFFWGFFMSFFLVAIHLTMARVQRRRRDEYAASAAALPVVVGAQQFYPQQQQQQQQQWQQQGQQPAPGYYGQQQPQQGQQYVAQQQQAPPSYEGQATTNPYSKSGSAASPSAPPM